MAKNIRSKGLIQTVEVQKGAAILGYPVSEPKVDFILKDYGKFNINTGMGKCWKKCMDTWFPKLWEVAPDLKPSSSYPGKVIKSLVEAFLVSKTTGTIYPVASSDISNFVENAEASIYVEDKHVVLDLAYEGCELIFYGSKLLDAALYA